MRNPERGNKRGRWTKTVALGDPAEDHFLPDSIKYGARRRKRDEDGREMEKRWKEREGEKKRWWLTTLFTPSMMQPRRRPPPSSRREAQRTGGEKL
jgi:hypothetical protein